MIQEHNYDWAGEFFGNGKDPVKECSYCGKTDGELVVTSQDHFGPTRWAHEDCIAEQEAKNERERTEQDAEIALWDARDRWEES